ncbi:MAG: septation protein SpoVG family protein [Eubacteriales bacterium]
MPKIDITINSIYDSGKIRGYCSATIDNSLSIRGIKFEKVGDTPEEVRVTLPTRENNAILSMFDNEFPSQLNMEAYYSYCSEIGIDMSVADPIENTQVNPKILDVLVTKINENPDSTMKAMANVTIDNCFSVNRVEIMDVDGILDVQMPQRKTVDVYKKI